MKPIYIFLCSLIGSFILFIHPSTPISKEYETKQKNGLSPNELHELVKQGGNFEEGLKQYKKVFSEEFLKLKKTRAGADWDYQGPYNIGGRVNTIAIHPTQNNIILMGTPNAGIFKTIDGGVTWKPVFDNKEVLAISHITYDPSNSNTVYAATGDQVFTRFSNLGNGIYKSIDGGETWNYLGLAMVSTITKIIVDPSNSNNIYAATLGNTFKKDNNRGLYKTTNGGTTWSQVFFLGQDQGIGDIVIHPNNFNTVYITGRTRFRSNLVSIATGYNTKIYKSINGGATWDTLSNGINYLKDSRIGLAISKTNPNKIYATVIDSNNAFSAIYKTYNGGTSWTLMCNASTTPISMSNFGWYFGETRLNPNNDEEVFVCAIDLFKSTDGGATFNLHGPEWWQYIVHADKHDVQFLSSTSYLVATDGGIFKTDDSGVTWYSLNNFSNIQFYGVAYNTNAIGAPYYAGAQDNGTLIGDANNPWYRAFGGDGFKPAFNKIDASNWYAAVQNGTLYQTMDDGISFNQAFSVPSGQSVNWEMPYFLNKANDYEIILGTDRVYNIDANTFMPTPLSPVLAKPFTNPDDAPFHNISSLAQSSIDNSKFYAGTSDGNVWVGSNTGWQLVINGLPSNRYVSTIEASTINANSFFVGFTGYRDGDSTAQIFYTSNNGTTYKNIAGNLPKFAINDILIVNGTKDSTLVVATDGGVYATLNAGGTWKRLGNNMPLMPVFDIEAAYAPVNLLIASTFAKGIMTISLDSLKANNTTATTSNLSSKIDVVISPNPCNNKLYIKNINTTINNYTIFNYTGQIMHQGKIINNTPIDVSKLVSGNYCIYFNAKNMTIKKTFLKE